MEERPREAKPAPPDGRRDNPCPDCGAPLAAQSSCVSCLSCGWAKC